MSLDEFIKRDRGQPDGIKPDDYFAACWDEATWQGKVYAIPTGTDNRALYYNKDALRAAGLVDAQGEAKPPTTWDELEDYALKLSEFTRDPQGAITDIRRIGFIPNYGNAWFYFYSWLNGGQLLSDDGRSCTLASAANVEAMDYVVRLYDRLGGARLVNAFQSSFQGAELDPFLTGRVAMKIDGNWVLNNIGNFRRELNFGVAPAPMPRKRREAGRPYISWAGGWSWVIPKGARHPEEAWRLIKWLASGEATLILNDAAREASLAQGKMFIPGLNANKNITQTLYRRYLADDPGVEQKFRDGYQVFMNLLPESRFRPVTPVGQFLWNQQVRAMEAAIYHRGSVETVLERHAAEVQHELDRIYRIRTEPVVNWSVPLIAYIAALIATAAILWWRHSRLAQRRRTLKLHDQPVKGEPGHALVGAGQVNQVVRVGDDGADARALPRLVEPSAVLVRQRRGPPLHVVPREELDRRAAKLLPPLDGPPHPALDGHVGAQERPVRSCPSPAMPGAAHDPMIAAAGTRASRPRGGLAVPTRPCYNPVALLTGSPPIGEKPVNCPRDGSVLAEAHVLGLELDKCHTCDGLWCDRGEMERLRDAKLAEVEEAIERKYGNPKPLPGKVSGHMRCPRCGDARLLSHRYTYVSPVTIDRCERCLGIWLDKGELTAIIGEKKALDQAAEPGRLAAFLRAMGRLVSRGK